MARRNLLAEAQVQAAAEVAPQVAALGEALQQARADRNSAIHAAATAYAGTSGAIHRAGPQVRKVFRGAQRSARGTDVIAKQTLAGLGSSPGVDTIRAAYAHEGAVGGAVVAKALASRLADLSDKRIAAAAGRAFSVNKANSDYSAAAAKNASQRSALAQQQGLLTGSIFSKLSEAAAGRRQQRLIQQRDQAFTAGQNALNRAADVEKAAADQSFTAHQNALNRRSDRRNTVYSQRQQNYRSRLSASGSSADSGPKPTATHVYKGRSDISTVAGIYRQEIDKQGGVDKTDLKKLAQQARNSKKGYAPEVVDAAADLATKGYISPHGVQKLAGIGITVPKEWTGVQVRPHTRKRRSK